MSHAVRFRVPLTCTNCGSLNDERTVHLYTSGLGQELADTSASPGEILDLELVDFEDGYFTLRQPTDDESTVVALEIWDCRMCLRCQVARLLFHRVGLLHWQFVDAQVVPLSTAVLDEAHFVSRKLEELAPNPGDDADRLRELQQRFTGKS
jgi:hypothetical protein